MDLLSQHEAFLRAIFDAPEDDTPRLVYADFLQEQGQEERAEFIRAQCELPQWERTPEPWTEADPRRDELLKTEARLIQKLYRNEQDESVYFRRIVRGFPQPEQSVTIRAEAFAAPDKLREKVVRWTPEWFGATAARVKGKLDPVWLDALFGLATFARVNELDLAGEEVADEGSLGTDYTIFTYEPVITTAGVAALSQHRGVRRLTALDLRNNELDNDAARALVASPYLDNLKRLQLLEGNRFRGKVWQQVIERFGEDVVG